jgi:hypothetical protein
MADETEHPTTAGAPTAAVPRAPVATLPARPKRVRKAGTGTSRGGRRKLTDEEKAQREQERATAAEQRANAEQQQAASRRQIARLAAMGALSPQLLEPQEISALSRFVLAMVQGVAPAAPEGQG